MTYSQGWTLSFQDRGTSTSDLAREAAREGAPSGSAFLLCEQTAGRGRQGRQWLSQPGGMYVSVLLYPTRSTNSWFALSFAAALAIYDVVKTHLTEQILQHDVVWGLLLSSLQKKEKKMIVSRFFVVAFSKLKKRMLPRNADFLAKIATVSNILQYFL